MRTRTLLLCVLVGALAGTAGWFAARHSRGGDKPATPGERKVLYYQSPMHPWITSEAPGRCTICGMKLEPVYEGQRGFSAAEGIITLGSNSVQVINVQTEVVTNRVLSRTLRIAGTIEDDDTKHRRMSAYAEGRIEKLFVNYVGGEVTAGQPLVVFYSPSLLAAESEYLTVARQKSSPEISEALQSERARLLEAAAQRLKRLGYSDAQLAALVKKDSADARTEILAPMTGTVVSRNVYEGQYVKEGDVLFEIGDFSTMWFQFDAYERDLGSLHIGQQVAITTPALPGKTFTVPITFIDPNLNAMTRSAKVRVEVANPMVEEGGRKKRLLYHSLYADGVVKVETPAVLTVPRTAVLSAAEPLVYVEMGNGAYEQRRVKLGRRGDDYVEVLDGVQPGERVVTTGNLIIDAQTQLDATARPMAGRIAAVPDQSRATNSQGLVELVSPALTDAQLAVAKDFLAQASAVSGALASDNLAVFNQQAAMAHAALPKLIDALGQQTALRPALAKLDTSGHLEKAATLDEARTEFVPFTTGVAELAQQLRARPSFNLKVYECPMADRAVKGAPKRVRWIQSEGPLRNPFFGARMLDCGTEVKPVINRLIEWSLRNRFIVLVATVFLIGWGIRAVYRTPVDAIPDLSENQVIVFADWAGRSPQEVEDQVTYPLSVNLQGLAGVKTVRANSMFGFSLITVIFEDKVDNYFARARVLERLNYLGNVLPAGVTPQLGPDATGLGWVYQYYLSVDPQQSSQGGYDLGQLRAVQDWFVRYQLNAVPGVAEVASVGGLVRQYQIEVSSAKMRAANVSLNEVMRAVNDSNLNVGGKVIEENGMEFVVRGIGLVNNARDLENVVLTETNGTPVYLRDVATVQIGGDFRRGALDVDGHEVVGGIIVMRTGENARDVIARVKEKIAQISPSLPPGVSIKPFYDRSELIERTIATLKHALWEEVILVTLAHIIFLWHFRSILIVTLPLPISILVSFVLMKQFGITSNIMSLSGIAIAIGVLVDAAIVMTENVIRHCENAEAAKGARLTRAETWQVVLEASKQVGRPIFFAMAIIILAFLPVFALEGQPGKLFHPLAFTKTFAMAGSTLLAVTIVPVLCTLLVRGPFHSEDRNWVMRVLLRIYDPVLNWALRHRKTVLSFAVLLLASALVIAVGLPRAATQKLEQWKFSGVANLVRGMGSEFMPPLNEGSLLFMPVLLPSTSLTEIKRIMAWQDQVISQTPEVASVGGKLGRSETATDPAPVEMIETTIMLKPEYIVTNRTWLGFIKIPRTIRNPEWRPGRTVASVQSELSEKLTQVPGYVPGFLQPIENRILMLSTGIRAQVGVKILGDNAEALQAKAFEVERVVRRVQGATGVAPSRTQGKPYIEIEVDRPAMARFGLRAQDVLEVVEAGLGGKNVTTTIEGRQRFPIQVRLERSERDDIERLGEVLVATPSGRFVPLGQVAKIRRTVGPSEIASENGRLRVFVQANVQDRDLGGFMKELQQRIRDEVKLDRGITIEYSGQYESQLRAQRTLTLIVPTVMVIIFLLLFVVYHSVKEAAHVILAVPFALTGGVFLQYLLGYNFSVAVWVGYIALFGTAIQTGVVMVVYLEEMLKKKQAERGAAFNRDDLIQAIKDGARLRLRPKVMTVATIVASLIPIMWSTRTGAEVMKPLATPVIGGMLSSLVHILIVTPVIFAWLRERELQKAPSSKPQAPEKPQ